MSFFILLGKILVQVIILPFVEIFKYYFYFKGSLWSDNGLCHILETNNFILTKFIACLCEMKVI